jgi:hypothetical protein
MKSNFTWDVNWGDDQLDSRDIIARFDDLKSDRDDLVEEWEDALNELNEYKNSTTETFEQERLDELQVDVDMALENLSNWDLENLDELDNLEYVVTEGESIGGDWSYGETLVRDEYFENYTEELISDCYELPKEINSGDWPYRHYTFDLTSAAEELKSDYSEIERDGTTYWVRS